MGQPVPKTMSLGHLTNGLTWAQICAANPQTVCSGDPGTGPVAGPRGCALASGGGEAIPKAPDSSQIVGHLKVWDCQSGGVRKTLLENTEGYVGGVTFSEDGKRLFAGNAGPRRKRGTLD